MNRKTLKLIILTLVLFFNFKISDALAYDCEYSDLGVKVTFNENLTTSVTQTKFKDIDSIPVIDWFVSVTSGQTEYIDELKSIEKELYGSCPEKIYACTYEKYVGGDIGLNIIWDGESSLFYAEQHKVYLFYSESNMKDNSKLAELPNKEVVHGTEINDNYTDAYDDGAETCGSVCGWAWGLIGGTIYTVGDAIGIDGKDGGGIDLYYNERKNCNFVNYTGSLLTYNLACRSTAVYLGRFNLAINEYSSCNGNAGCMSSAIAKINNAEESLKKYCKSIIENYNYDDEVEKECINSCLDVVNKVVGAKKSVGLLSDGTANDCGVSDRLMVWIVNILRWIKYILPVIVIILGILDFIKAIGSDKEDEMKKAQKSFVTRLIAAALVFLIPLIVEFVLVKMGFGYNDCGLF